MIFSHANLSNDNMANLAHTFETEVGVTRPRGLLHQMVVDGTYKFVIAGKTKPQYACWFYVQADKMFHANAVLSVSDGNKLSDLLKVGEEVARHEGCRGIIFATKHRGLIRQSRNQGYRQTAVVMERSF